MRCEIVFEHYPVANSEDVCELLWFQVTLANWYGQDGREKYVKFMEDVIQRTIEPPWNEDYAKRNNISVQ